jgi:hypothetical protein
MSVYLYLFHGRASIDQDMTDWGAEGPKIGPLSYVHTTYGSDVKIRGSREVLERFFPKAAVHFHNGFGEHSIQLEGDCLPHEGKLYGDWTVCTAEYLQPRTTTSEAPACAARHDQPDPLSWDYAGLLRAVRDNPLVLRVWRRFLRPQAGQRFDISSGMGGVLTIKLLRQQDDGRWQARVDTPLNPDWHGYLIDHVAVSALLPVRAGTSPEKAPFASDTAAATYHGHLRAGLTALGYAAKDSGENGQFVITGSAETGPASDDDGL